MNPSSNLFMELDKTELAEIIGRNFDGDDDFHYELLSGGMFNTTYLITFRPGKKVVLRVGPINRHLLLPFEENLMSAEAYVYTLCKTINIPVSNVIVCDSTKAVIDRDYMIVDYIESVALASLNVPEDVSKELHEKVGFFAKQLHTVTNTQFGRVSEVIQGKGCDKWSGCLKSEVEKFVLKVRNIDIYSENDLQRIRDVFVKNASLFDEIKMPHLVHADLWAGNVLVSQNDSEYSVAAIIDADRAVFGDVEFEFASEWMINDAFLAGYGQSLSDEKDTVIRRKMYALIYNLNDSYICLAQYNNAQNSDNCRNTALQLLDELS